MDEIDRVARLIGEFCDRRDRGEPITLEELCQANPEIEEQLRAGLATMKLLDHAYDEATGNAPNPTCVPKTIGGYRILSEIGRGGMGVVFEAEQVNMRRRVALKLLSPGITGVAQAIRRFQREAQAAGTLHHTNIVPIYEMDQSAGYWFYAMELVRGRSLADIIDETRTRTHSRAAESSADSVGAPPPSHDALTDSGDRGYFDRVAEIFAEVADGLQVAHEAGVVHRDIKPANLLLDADGRLKIVDFGLAHLDSRHLSMTLSGQMLGTPLYMSPEQAMAKRMGIDHRTDIYSLGATFYEFLTSRPPFEAENIRDLCSQIITKDPASPRRANPRIPRDLETICLKAMSKDRDERYQTAQAFARDLRTFATGGAIRARRIGLAGRSWRRVKRRPVRATLAAVVVVLAVVGGWLASRAVEEARQRREIQYEMLIADGTQALIRRSPGLGAAVIAGRKSAVECFTEAIELRQDRPQAWVGRLLARGSTEPFETAQADIRAARAAGLGERAALLLELLNCELHDRKSDAEALGLRVKRLEPEGPLDHYLEGMILVWQARYEEAIPFLDDAVGTYPEGDPMRLLARRVRAVAESRLGRREDALGDLLAVTAGGDHGIVIRMMLADAWDAVGKAERADQIRRELLDEARRAESVDVCEELARGSRGGDRWLLKVGELAIEIDPRDARGHWFRGYALLGWNFNDRYEEALQSIDRAIALAPPEWDTAGFRVGRATALVDLGRIEEAREEVDRVLARELRTSDEAWARVTRALILREERAEEALVDLDRALQLGGGDEMTALAFRGRAAALCRLGRYDEAVEAARRAVELSPGDPNNHAALAASLARSGRPAEALTAAAEAVRLGPHLWNAQASYGMALQDLGKLEAAKEALGKALDIAPGRRSVRDRYARVLLDLNDLDRAEEVVSRTRELFPLDISAAVKRVLISERRGRIEEALEHSSRVLEILNSATDLSLTAALTAYHNHVEVLAKLGRFEDAEKVAGLALGLPREDGDESLRASLLAYRAHARYRLGKAQEALDDADRALELDTTLFLKSECFFLHLTRLNAYRQLGRVESALAAIDSLLDPLSDPRLRAVVLVEKGALLCDIRRRYEEALAAIDSALELDPDNARGHSCRATVLVRLKRLEEAVAAAGRACELDEKGAIREHSVAMLDQLARFLGKSGHFAARLRALDFMLATDERNVDLLVRRASTLGVLERYDEALETVERALELAPDDPRALAVRAQSLIPTRPLDALAGAERVLEREPKDWFARFIRGNALIALGRNDEALTAWDDLLVDYPKLGLAHGNRGMTLLALQRYVEALPEFEEASRLAPPPREYWIECQMTALAALGRIQEALDAAAYAEDRSKVADAYVFLLRAQGRGEQALEVARACVADSDSPYLHAVAGDPARARRLALERRGIPVLTALTCVDAFAALRDKEAVLTWLRRAVELGFRPDRRAPNPELAWLADDEDYRQLLQEARDLDAPK